MERLKYKMKSLIIFFSHRGENYSVGYIKEGNVEHIAKVIKELTNADIYELVPEVPYSENYRECVKQSVKEMQENSRPMFKNPLPNLDGYDLIYLCYPNWCGSFPRIVATFLEKYDFHNKITKILPKIMFQQNNRLQSYKAIQLRHNTLSLVYSLQLLGLNQILGQMTILF